MATLTRQGRALKNWLQQINQFEHVDSIPLAEQRLATRIYVVLLTSAIIGLLVYSSISVQQYTTNIYFPSSKDFIHLQSLQYAKLSCPCHTITIPYGNFITLEPIFHPVCSSQFVTRTWSDGFFFENASTYLPMDIRSTLSAQYQLLSSLCVLAQQTVNDELQSFKATQFVSTQVILNSTLQVQVDALTTAFKSSASSSLLRAITLIRQTSFANQFVSAVGSNSVPILLEFASQYYVGQGACNFQTMNGDDCGCYNSYTCHIPVGVFNVTMPTSMPMGCIFTTSINDSLTIFNGLYVGCLPFESLLASTLVCLYDKTCLETLQQYLTTNINISVLTLPVQGQFTQDSNISEIINQLFVHQWNLNISYDAFFNTCAPIVCSYTYTETANFVYITATLLGFYGGLTVVLQFLVLLAMKYRQLRNARAVLLNHDTSSIEKLRIIFCKLKKATIKLNLFVEEEKLTIDQQRITTRVFFVLVSSAVFILILFSMLTTQVHVENIHSPTQDDFERLQKLYPDKLSCPCSQIIIPQNQFIKLSPNFHPVCSSMFVSQEWFDALVRATSTGEVSYFLDFRFVALANFIQLQSFCILANQTIQDSLAIFDETPFISGQALSVSILNIQSYALATTFQQSTEDIFSLQIKFIQNMSYGNQLLSSLFTNANIDATNSSKSDLNIEIVSEGYQTSDILSCSCMLEPFACASSTGIYGSVDQNLDHVELLVPISTFFLGCFAIDSLFMSTLECFYNQSCLDTFQAYIPDFNMTALNISQSIQYKANTSIGEIIEQLLVEEWNTSISFEQYFSACSPQLCTYTYENRDNIVFLITTLFSLFGGLTVVFQFVSPFLTLLFFKRYRHHVDTPNITYYARLRNLLLFLRSLPSKFWKYIVTLNLFNQYGQQQDEQRILLQQYTTRVYLCILFSALIILGIYRTISSNTFVNNIDNPSQITFERLYNQYTDMLICPCSQISMPYSQFVDIEFTLHPICSSEFITQTWFNAIFTTDNFTYSDFRLTALAHFQLLDSFCQLANNTLNNARSSFLAKKFISTDVISSDAFANQIETAIQLFQLNTRSNFIRVLQLIRDTTSGNALMTVYTSSWRYVAYNTDPYSTIFTRSMTYNHENGSCSCGTSGDCSQPAAVYNDTESIIIPGIRVGCYPLNAVLQSTLECLYDQECVDLLRNIFNISTMFTAINNTLSSNFYPNTTTYSLVDQLLVENWQTVISYEQFFTTCAASVCSFSYSQRANLVYVVTTLVGLYGGLDVSLSLLSPILVSVFKRIVERVMRLRANRVMPITN